MSAGLLVLTLFVAQPLGAIGAAVYLAVRLNARTAAD